MAESMKGLKRTHRCTEVSNANIGETVTVMGWVAKQRNKGGIIFPVSCRSSLKRQTVAVRLLQKQRKCEANL